MLVLICVETVYAKNDLTEISGTPVLAVDAGVLPTSRLYFLDKIDEWAQKNMFAFGVNSFRIEAALQNSVERISELQFLNGNEELDDEKATELLERWRDDLIFASSLVGKSYEKGGRPISQTDGVMRTMLMSASIIEEEAQKKYFLDEKKFTLPEDFLDKSEEIVLANLLPDSAIIPEQVLAVVVDDIKVDLQQAIEKTRLLIQGDIENNVVRFGGKKLLEVASVNKEMSEEFIAKGNLRDSMKLLAEARQALRLIDDESVVIDMGSVVDEADMNVFLDKAAEKLLNSGFIDIDEIVKEQEITRKMYQKLSNED